MTIFIPSNTFATDTADFTYVSSTSTTEIRYLSNGYYEVITLEEYNTPGITPVINSTNSSTKSGQKTSYIKNNNNETVATFTIKGTSSYTGTSCSCTAASYSSSINNSLWKFTSRSATPSGNSAIGNFTIKLYILNIPVQTVTDSITLSCDNNGNLS